MAKKAKPQKQTKASPSSAASDAAAMELDWSGGLGGLNLNWKGSYGIVFYEYRRETVFGFQIKDGRLTPVSYWAA